MSAGIVLLPLILTLNSFSIADFQFVIACSRSVFKGVATKSSLGGAKRKSEPFQLITFLSVKRLLVLI